MGTSYVTLNEPIAEDQQQPWVGAVYGFWVKDYGLVQFLSALREEIAATADTPDWLRTLSLEWSSVSEEKYGSGCELIFPHDMTFDDQAKAAVFTLCRKVLDKVLANRGDFTLAYPTTKWTCTRDPCVCTPPPEVSPPDLSERMMFLEIGMRFCDLMMDRIETGERGAVIGPRPPEWISLSRRP